MYAGIYALSRLILFGFGWSIAATVALLAEMMLSGVLWPLFAFIAGWWTFVCAVYVEGESSQMTSPSYNNARDVPQKPDGLECSGP